MKKEWIMAGIVRHNINDNLCCALGRFRAINNINWPKRGKWNDRNSDVLSGVVFNNLFFNALFIEYLFLFFSSFCVCVLSSHFLALPFIAHIYWLCLFIFFVEKKTNLFSNTPKAYVRWMMENSLVWSSLRCSRPTTHCVHFILW